MISESQPQRPLRPLLLLGLAGLVALLALAGGRGYRELTEARRHEARLRAEIAATEGRTDRLLERLDALQNDPATLEHEVRESLRWIRPDEVVLLVEEPGPQEPVAEEPTSSP